MRIGLVGCVKSKLTTRAPARDLYISPLFVRRRAWVERTCDRWFVLSALHGLVEPEQELEPYDLALSDVPAADRRRWSDGVMESLNDLVGPVDGHTFDVHAGDVYVESGLAEALRRNGAVVDRPMRGLSLGQQLAAYGTGQLPDRPSEELTRNPRPSTPRTAPSSAGRGKYSPLHDALTAVAAATVTFQFGDIERILGFPLPASARRYAAWWQNDASGTHSQAKSWLQAGRMARVDLVNEQVTFTRYGGPDE